MVLMATPNAKKMPYGADDLADLGATPDDLAALNPTDDELRAAGFTLDRPQISGDRRKGQLGSLREKWDLQVGFWRLEWKNDGEWCAAQATQIVTTYDPHNRLGLRAIRERAGTEDASFLDRTIADATSRGFGWDSPEMRGVRERRDRDSGGDQSSAAPSKVRRRTRRAVKTATE